MNSGGITYGVGPVLAGIAVGVITASIISSAKSGPLDPPPGSIEPTNKTLQEIYDLVASVSANAGCGCGPWQSTVTGNVGDSVIVPLVQGSGILHAVIAPEGRHLRLYSQNGTVLIADIRATNGGVQASTFILNIEFTNGLSYNLGQSASTSKECTVLYKLN